MYPFECSKCRNRIYAPSARLASCCTGAKMTPLTNICLLVPLERMPENNHIHTTPDNNILTAGGQQWCTACNAPSLPRTTTPLIQAATCHKCLQAYKVAQEKWQLKYELDSIEEASRDFFETAGIEFIDEENPENSFSSEIKEVRKELENTNPELDKILEKIKSLHQNLENRKIVSARMKQLDNLLS